MADDNQPDRDRCPHCGIAKPFFASRFYRKNLQGEWFLFECQSCWGMVLTLSPGDGRKETWPNSISVSENVPQKAREFLTQALASLHAPAGAWMLTASSVDVMLKDKGYKKGCLNDRIKAAEADHLITSEMADWAHEVRLDANDQRHADESAPLPDQADAKRSLDFALALCEFMYVLPAKVAAGRKQTPLSQ